MNKRQGKNLLLVDLEEGLLDLLIVQKFLSKGVNIFLAQERCPSYIRKILPKKYFIKTNPFDTRSLVTDVMSFINTNGIWFDGIGTFSENAVPATSVLTQMLGLKGINPGMAFRSSNFKLSMREFCRLGKIDMPHFVFVDTLTERTLKKAIAQIGGPAVIKPVSGYSSASVYKIDGKDKLCDIIRNIKTSYKVNKDGILKNSNNKYLVESYIEGIQISVDGIIADNKVQFAGIVETEVSSPPNFTAYANYFPPRISSTQYNASLKYCKKILQSLEFNNCAFHCELKLKRNKPFLIEIACRPPGGRILEGYKLAFGIDFMEALLDLWLGNTVSLEKKRSRYVNQSGIFSEKGGELTSIRGIGKLRKMQGLHEITRVLNAGDEIITYPNTPVPVYYFSVEASSIQELENKIKLIKQTVILEVT